MFQHIPSIVIVQAVSHPSIVLIVLSYTLFKATFQDCICLFFFVVSSVDCQMLRVGAFDVVLIVDFKTFGLHFYNIFHLSNITVTAKQLVAFLLFS